MIIICTILSKMALANLNMLIPRDCQVFLLKEQLFRALLENTP